LTYAEHALQCAPRGLLQEAEAQVASRDAKVKSAEEILVASENLVVWVGLEAAELLVANEMNEMATVSVGDGSAAEDQSMLDRNDHGLAAQGCSAQWRRNFDESPAQANVRGYTFGCQGEAHQYATGRSDPVPKDICTDTSGCAES
jgi:hypothetical protein